MGICHVALSALQCPSKSYRSQRQQGACAREKITKRELNWKRNSLEEAALGLLYMAASLNLPSTGVGPQGILGSSEPGSLSSLRSESAIHESFSDDHFLGNYWALVLHVPGHSKRRPGKTLKRRVPSLPHALETARASGHFRTFRATFVV